MWQRFELGIVADDGRGHADDRRGHADDRRGHADDGDDHASPVDGATGDDGAC
jgi:hypothetical protein